MQQDDGLLSYHFNGETNKTANKHGMKRENMSTVMKKGVDIRSKAVTTQVFTVVGLLVEPGASISKIKGYLEDYPSIMQPSILVTSNSPVIYSSIFSYLFLELHFSLTYKMYVNMGQTLDSFLIYIDVEGSM